MKKIVIIGGGIAGTTCAEYISACSTDVDIKIIIIAAKDVVKTAVTTRKLTRIMNELQVDESSSQSFELQFPNVSVVNGFVSDINPEEHFVKLADGQTISYTKLCICSGGKPNIILESNPYVCYIRDTDTVEVMQKRLSNAKKVVIIGNGGIALELVHEIDNCHIIWCMKSDHIGNAFFDESAASFLLSKLTEKNNPDQSKEAREPRKSEQTIFSRRVYEVEKEFIKGNSTSNSLGCALGPDWSKRQKLSGCCSSSSKEHEITIMANTEPKRIFSCKERVENVYVEFTNGETVGADFVICCTGVVPNIPMKFIGLSQPECSSDGGIFVDENMRTNIKDIYAAGDCCTAKWNHSQHWYQMKLWTQGWQMGAFAGKSIVENLKNNESQLDFCFELFTHATNFFGFKVCLLGCYNCQNLQGQNFEYLIRHTKGIEFIKLVMLNGRVQGAVLIGDTDLEETFENLILNQIDVGFLKESLLDPNVDIADFFD